MNKKGVELSMNLIIIAAIGLLILVILAVLIIGSMNNTNNAMKSCNLKGGICSVSCTNPEDILYGDNMAPLCDKTPSKPICCKVVPT